MNFPLIPLIGLFSYLEEFNVVVSLFVVMLTGFIAFLSLLVSAVGKYNKTFARLGVWCLIVAIAISIVGIAYPLLFVCSVISIYFLIYWVIWRLLIKNLIVTFTPDKPNE